MSDPIRSISQNNYLLSNGGGGGGGGHEYSGANGVYVDNVNEVIGLETSASNAIETVIENSGAWGGAGLPISAGPGINVSLENGTLVISNDETVLWSGTLTTGSSATLNENITNFERIAFEGYSHNGIAYSCRAEAPVLDLEMHMIGLTSWPGETDLVTCDITDNNKVSTRGTYVEAGSTLRTFAATLTKVVGIGRKST